MTIDSVFNFLLHSNLRTCVVCFPICAICSIYTLNKSTNKECNVYKDFGIMTSTFLFLSFICITDTAQALIIAIYTGFSNLFRVLILGAFSLVLCIPYTIKNFNIIKNQYGAFKSVVYYIALITYGFIRFIWFVIRFVLLPLGFFIPVLAIHWGWHDDD